MSCMDNIFIGVWIEYKENINHTYTPEGYSLEVVTKRYLGPFEDWSDAFRKVEDDNMVGVVIHDFT